MGSIFSFITQNSVFYKNSHNSPKHWRIFNFLEAFLWFWEWVRRWHWPFWKISKLRLLQPFKKIEKILNISKLCSRSNLINNEDLLTEFPSKKFWLDLQHRKKLRSKNLLLFRFFQKLGVIRPEMDSGGSIYYTKVLFNFWLESKIQSS